MESGKAKAIARFYLGVLLIETQNPEGNIKTWKVCALGPEKCQQLVNAAQEKDEQAVRDMLADMGQSLTDEEIQAIMQSLAPSDDQSR